MGMVGVGTTFQVKILLLKRVDSTYEGLRYPWAEQTGSQESCFTLLNMVDNHDSIPIKIRDVS